MDIYQALNNILNALGIDEAKTGEKVGDQVPKFVEALKRIEDKNQAYKERNILVSILLKGMARYPDTFKVFRAKHPEDDKEWERDWMNIAGVEYLSITSGFVQAVWHFHDKEIDLIKDLPLNKAYVWDGHTTDEKYKKLIKDFNHMFHHDAR